MTSSFITDRNQSTLPAATQALVSTRVWALQAEVPCVTTTTTAPARALEETAQAWHPSSAALIVLAETTLTRLLLGSPHLEVALEV